MTTLYFAIGLLLLGILFLVLSLRIRKSTGLPPGRIVYSDTRMPGQPLEKPLYDGTLKLTGKPDYLVEENGALIPVEVKSSQTPAAPYDPHIFQLAAYCLLVEAVYKRRPPYGLIRYPGRTFKVDFTAHLRDRAENLVLQMQADQSRRDIERSHQDPNRCRGCGFRERCDQHLD
jgi:CRISPR-associated exonuclease Cas4